MRTFPNGRFAEIAQMRLNRLLAETEKPASDKIVPLAPVAVATATPAAGTKGVPAIRSEAEYDALPKGTTYLDPEGNLRRKS
jgi:hypothetical protein